MDDKTLDRMSSDLRIHRYTGESVQLFKCRVLYSAVSSWIKTIAMDRAISSRDGEFSGVSRRHIFDRSSSIIETMCKMFPETKGWFFHGEDHPSNIIRTRLINHGDLLNEGFDTYLALSTIKRIQITDKLKTVYGVVLDGSIAYSGVSTIMRSESVGLKDKDQDYLAWFSKYQKEAGWSMTHLNTDSWQYYNPYMKTLNNYSAWQDAPPQEVDGIVFARTEINKNSYEYYLIKNKEEVYHRLDPFAIKVGYHKRIMYLLRAMVNNNILVTATVFDEHVSLRFNTHLPMQENNLLESYAWPVNGIDDKLEWVMDKDVWEYIKKGIMALKIRIEEK